MRENRESFYDLFLCSRRSRCSRFMFLKRSVRWNFHRETRENREQKNGVSPVDLKRFKVESKKRFTLPQEREPKAVKEEEVLVRAVRVVRGLGF